MKGWLVVISVTVGCGLGQPRGCLAGAGGRPGPDRVAANVFLNVLDNAMTLAPTAADYTNDYVQVTGATGLRVQLKTNSPTGLVLYVKCTDAAPPIRLGDLLVKTQTAPIGGGTSLTTFTAVTATELALWSTGVALSPFTQVDIDLRVKNLSAYTDPIGAGTTSYTDNLTFTVIAQ